MQKRKIIAVILAASVVVAAFVGYEYFVVDSLSGYTKITLTKLSEESISVEFNNGFQYNISFGYVIVPEANSNGANLWFYVVTNQSLDVHPDGYALENFAAVQGHRYSFQGLQIIVGSAKSNLLILYVKYSSSNSKPILSPISTTPSPTVS